MKILIKKLDKNGFKGFFSLLNQMSEWENRGTLNTGVEKQLKKDYFCKNPKYEAFLAWEDNKVIGMTVFHETYATFDANPTTYVEDLFLLEEYRHKGIGKKLFGKILETAKKRKHSRVELLAYGEDAGKFYKKLGFKLAEQDRHYRLYL